MRLIITILLFIPFVANATNYYVSNSGSNSANGLTQGTAWQTISKVNSSSFSAGDSILFKCGDIWNEQLIVPSSGSAGNPIVFSYYGTGAKPIITGFQTLTGWTNLGNIWSSTFSNSARYQNTVYINGTVRCKGRYPNYGWLTFSSHSGYNQITGSLTGTPDYTGGEVVIRNNHWTLDHPYITSQSAGTINFTPAVYYSLNDGNGYFIQNIQSALDTLNEWCFDTTTKVIKVYATSQPTVKASSIDTLIYLLGKQYITFSNINIEGANVAAIQADSSNHIMITNDSIINCGGNGIDGKKLTYSTVSNCFFKYILNDAIHLGDILTGLADSDDCIVTNNTISNIGKLQGMGKNRFQTYEGLVLFGDRARITNNNLDSIGYIGIHFFGDTVLVKNNLIQHFCSTKDDGGGIDVWMGAGTKIGDTILSNIVRCGLTALDGNLDQTLSTVGIYADNESLQVVIDSNFVDSMPQAGVFLHYAHYCTVTNNTLTNCKYPIYVVYQVNNVLKYNVLYTNTNYLISATLSMSVSDSNYLCTQGDTTKSFEYFGNRSLTYWRSTLGFDIHSTTLPGNITAASPLIKYNSSATTVNYPLTGTYIDARGRVYSNQITLQPFQSSVLFKATYEVVMGVKLGTLKFQ